MLERDAAWSYHSVKQNVLISQLNGSPASPGLSFSSGYGLHGHSKDSRKEFHKVRGQGIVHAMPETTFNCISDLDMYALWDGFSNEQQVIAEYPMGNEEGLMRILYIRFNGIFPVASRDICVCTIKRRLNARNFKSKGIIKGRNSTESSAPDSEAFLLVAFSIDHPSCPPSPGFVRAELRSSGFIIRPLSNSSCSTVTYIIQFNAKGWLPTALSSMVSEYQPLRIAKIRDIAHTYQYTHSASKASAANSWPENSSSTSSAPSSTQNQSSNTATPSSSSTNASSSRFGWVQQCRGALREEEEFIIAERQALDEASAESLKSKFRPVRYNSASSSLSGPSKKQRENQSSAGNFNQNSGNFNQNSANFNQNGNQSNQISSHNYETVSHRNISHPRRHSRSSSTGSGSSRSHSSDIYGAAPSSSNFSSSRAHTDFLASSPSSRVNGRSHEHMHHSLEGIRPPTNEGEGGEIESSSSDGSSFLHPASIGSSKRKTSRTLKPRSSYGSETSSSYTGATFNSGSEAGPAPQYHHGATSSYIDSDSEEGDLEVDSDDSTTFYEVASDIHESPTLFQPGADGYPVLLRILNSDVDHIKSVQVASQHKLEVIEANLKSRSAENAHLVDHLEGLKAFLSACMDKLRTYSNEHKSMEALRMRWEAKWHTKLASVTQKLKDAQRGYWTPRRARQAAFYRYSTLLLLVIIWPAIFIRVYAILQRPQRFFARCAKLFKLLSYWLVTRSTIH